MIARDNQIYGSLPPEDLPSEIWAMTLEGNLMSGTLDFSKMPKGLEMLNLKKNNFTGSVNLRMITYPFREASNDRLNYMEANAKKPIGEIFFDLNLSDNPIKPEILVHDVDLCDLDGRIPSESQIIDRNGKRAKFYARFYNEA
uniref:Non-specific serine/threonine protein kinase n=1 Tax=Paramoeba aestuarina TaxID=180227 RepID=A0A7S4NLX0_9EUKA|mmetsp:Transcript_2036/g.3180  ORF Transcript_2036/g.3180 Transcript_2036/m.3180 type:complete len:143 (+) Transcript_2036:482-910(+)